MSESTDALCMKPGHVGWNELVANNPRAAADFYGRLFGWQATPFVPQGTKLPAEAEPYTIFKLNPNDEMGIGGMMPAKQSGAPSMWMPYVVVENVDASLKKAVGLGAKECLPVTSLGEIGRIAIIRDPQGATIGLHELPKA